MAYLFALFSLSRFPSPITLLWSGASPPGLLIFLWHNRVAQVSEI